MYWVACLGVLFLTFGLTIVVTSIGYHRGLAHGAVCLHPRVRRLVVVGGHWVTGIDPKAWVVMHRLHHEHSDRPSDPHSPVNVGMAGVPLQQFKSYARVLLGLYRGDPGYSAVAPDVPLSWPIRSGWWALPHTLHLGIAAILGAAAGGWLLGAAYGVGIMSHGAQGVLINAFGHGWGGRNFDTDDNSRNNHPSAWLLLGEGFQNNHHRYPASARFSYRRWEVDSGFGLCRLLERLGVLTINRGTLIPSPPDARDA
jgi:stearoyl-CoA desaturase (delta-9 desaturase)